MGFSYTNFLPSADTNRAKNKRNEYENAINNYGDFQYGRENDYQKAIDSYLNREKFSYDVGADPMYKQYKDQYIGLGRQAMADTVAQVAANNGGFGNSYGASAGSAAYQNYLSQLNDVIPQLYNNALNAYNAEGERMANNYNILASDRSNAYNTYIDKYNRLASNRDYYGNQYNTGISNDRAAYDSDRSFSYTQYQNAIANQLERDRLNETIRANKVSEAAAAKANDQSATIKALQNQIENSYNPTAANKVLSSIVDISKFKKVNSGHNNKTAYLYNGKKYNSYNDYKLEVIKDAYNQGNINTETYKQLLISEKLV